jgi:hypothetical protein
MNKKHEYASLKWGINKQSAGKNPAKRTRSGALCDDLPSFLAPLQHWPRTSRHWPTPIFILLAPCVDRPLLSVARPALFCCACCSAPPDHRLVRRVLPSVLFRCACCSTPPDHCLVRHILPGGRRLAHDDRVHRLADRVHEQVDQVRARLVWHWHRAKSRH